MFFFAAALCFVMLVWAAPSPSFVFPTPADSSTITDEITFYFDFTGTVNYTLTGNFSGTPICAANNSLGGITKECDWNSSAAGINQTSYNFTLFVMNSSNASDNASVSRVFKVDIPLSITPDEPANESILSGTATINFTSNNAGSDDNFFLRSYYNNSNSWVQFDTTTTWSENGETDWDTTLVADGTYRVNLSIQDISNSSDIAYSLLEFTVVNPVNPNVTFPTNDSFLSGTEIINITFGGDANITISYHNGTNWTTIASTTSATSPWTYNWDTDAFDEGVYDLNITIVDSDNVSDSAYINVSNITIDSTSPTVFLISPANNSIINTSSVDFNWSAADNVDSEVVCNFSLDGSFYAAFTDTNTTETLGDGTYTWSITCFDDALNTNTTEIRSFIVDTTAPTIDSIVIIQNSSGYTDDTPDININITEDTLTLCQYHLGDGNWTNLTRSGTSPNYYCTGTVPTQPEGATLNFTFRVTDIANNTVTQQPINLTVDSISPVFINLSINDTFVIQNSAVTNNPASITINDKTVYFSWVINETNYNQTYLFQSFDSVYNDTSGSLINSTSLQIKPGHHMFEFELYDDRGSSYKTTQFFSVYVNGVTNVTNITQELMNYNVTNVTYTNFTILQDGLDVSTSDSSRLNGSVGFHVEFNASSTNYTVDIESINGLYYNWEELFGFQYGTGASIINETGINNSIWVAPFNYYTQSVEVNSSYYEDFLPTNTTVPSVNITVNTSNNLLVVAFDIPNQVYYLLQECGSTEVSSFAEACYVNNTINYTIHLPELAKIYLGYDSSDPIINYTFNQLNDSLFNLTVDVIEPSPNTTNFCDLGIYSGATGLYTFNMSSSNFTLTESRYTTTLSFTNFSNGDYTVNATCRDTNNFSTTFGEEFTIADVTPPTISGVSADVGTDYLTVSASSNEHSRMRINYSTDDENINSNSSYSSYGTSFEETVTRLAANTRYYYRVEICDLNDQCSYSPSLTLGSSFSTGSYSSSGGGGGGGGGGTYEGMIVASHYHGWSTLDAGWNEYYFNEPGIAITKIAVMLEEDTFDPFVQVFSYQGKASSVPRINATAFQYLRLQHSGLVGTRHEIEFRIPQEYLDSYGATTRDVEFYRLQANEWTSYPLTVLQARDDHSYFRVALPGFSFFVIRVDKEGPLVNETVEFNITEEVNVTEESNVSEEVIEEVVIEEVEEIEEESVGYEEKKEFSFAFLWVVLIIVVILVVSGGTWYVLTKKPKVEKTPLNRDDPFFKLQEFIIHALDKGHTPEEIRAKLLEVGWDEVVVDEELQTVMNLRV